MNNSPEEAILSLGSKLGVDIKLVNKKAEVCILRYYYNDQYIRSLVADLIEVVGWNRLNHFTSFNHGTSWSCALSAATYIDLSLGTLTGDFGRHCFYVHTDLSAALDRARRAANFTGEEVEYLGVVVYLIPKHDWDSHLSQRYHKKWPLVMMEENQQKEWTQFVLRNRTFRFPSKSPNSKVR